jgi:hypothetical protein
MVGGAHRRRDLAADVNPAVTLVVLALLCVALAITAVLLTRHAERR